MLDLTVVTDSADWVLQDEAGGELGRYESRAAAVEAAWDVARVTEELRVVLIRDDEGEWEEMVVEPPHLH